MKIPKFQELKDLIILEDRLTKSLEFYQDKINAKEYAEELKARLLATKLKIENLDGEICSALIVKTK